LRDGDEGATVPERKRKERTGLWQRLGVGKGKESKATPVREAKTSKSSYKRLSSLSKRNTWL
jgi:hypothetical protein